MWKEKRKFSLLLMIAAKEFLQRKTTMGPIFSSFSVEMKGMQFLGGPLEGNTNKMDATSKDQLVCQ